MTRQTKILTYSEYLKVRKAPLKEIVDGAFIMSASPILPHQLVLANLYRSVYQFVNEGQLGLVLFAPMDVIVREEPLRVRQPDLLFISNENIGILGYRIHGGPDLVVEVLSPSNSRSNIESKLADYGQIEVKESWLVSPEARTVEALILKEGNSIPPTAPRSILWERLSIHGLGDVVESAILPGIALPVSEIFAGA